MYPRTSTPVARGLLRLPKSLSSQCYNGIAPSQRFSTTARNDIRALFNETENPELNELFKTIQEKVIFPSHLPEAQRKMVYSPKDAAHLERNPIIIELEGVEHRFETIDVRKDVPRSRILLDSVLKAMETDADWDNLPTLLAGYTKAGYHLRPEIQSKITRVATEKDNIRVILESAKQSYATGFFIASREQLAYLQLYILGRLDAAAGDVQGIEKCVKLTEHVLSILLRPDHIARFKTNAKSGWLQNSVLFRSTLVHTRAQLYQAKKAAGEPFEKDLLLLTDEIKTLSALWARHGDAPLESITDFNDILAMTPEGSAQYERPGRKNGYALSQRRHAEYLARNIQAVELVDSLAREHPDDFAPVSAEINETLLPAAGRIDAHLREWAPTSKFKDSATDAYSKVLGRELL